MIRMNLEGSRAPLREYLGRLAAGEVFDCPPPVGATAEVDEAEVSDAAEVAEVAVAPAQPLEARPPG